MFSSTALYSRSIDKDNDCTGNLGSGPIIKLQLSSVDKILLDLKVLFIKLCEFINLICYFLPYIYTCSPKCSICKQALLIFFNMNNIPIHLVKQEEEISQTATVIIFVYLVSSTQEYFCLRVMIV